MMELEPRGSRYEPLSSEEQLSHTHYSYDPGRHHGPGDGITANPYRGNLHQAQRLEPSWTKRIVRLVFDLAIAAVCILFGVFGVAVLANNGRSAAPGSIGRKLFDIAQYTPTIFPVVFAAVVGGALKTVASWRIQTTSGATVDLVERCLGSQTLSRAFLTQIKLRAFNVLGIITVVLWCLSPLGSQASLRIVSVVHSVSENTTGLTAINTFEEYQFGNAEGISQAETSVAGPVIASLLAAKLLASRNQDLWGNVRFPAIERLEGNSSNSKDGWLELTRNDDLTYPSLVGTPIKMLPNLGNTSFTLNGSYLSISCPVFGKSDQTIYTNYTDAPSPGNGDDCSWASEKGGSQYQIALSMPCQVQDLSGGTRRARKLVWESSPQGETPGYTRAECELTTTYVDTNVTCTASASGDSSGGTCDAFAVRRSVSPLYDSNWTVLDYGFFGDAPSILKLLTTLFPSAQLSGGLQPVATYLVDPYQAVGSAFDDTTDGSTYTAGRSAFEIRLAQLLNAILYLGISPPDFTGSFNTTLVDIELGTQGVLYMNATTIVQRDVVQCNRGWLGVLLIASLVSFLCALTGALLRLVTFGPDVLGSISIALLHNKVKGVNGSSIWDSDEWARNLKDTRLYLADIDPLSEVGRIAIAASSHANQVNRIKRGRYYL